MEAYPTFTNLRIVAAPDVKWGVKRMQSDVEKLLADEESRSAEARKDVQAEPTASEPSAEPKAEGITGNEAEKARKEAERVKSQLKIRQEENARLKEENERLKAERSQPSVQDQKEYGFDTRNTEGWLKKIEETAEAKASSVFSKIREANLLKAKKRFVSMHPEYAGSTPESQDKLRKVFERSAALGLGAAVDDGEMVEVFQDAWAVENRKELEVIALEQEKSRSRAQKSVARVSSGGGSSSPIEDNYTEEEKEAAAKRGMTPERYREVQAVYENDSIEI